MENSQIAAAQISASSQFDVNHVPSHGRLHYKGIGGAWTASANVQNRWFQIDLRVEANVTFVASQANYLDPNQRVTQYKLQYSKDGLSFQVYKDTGENSDKVRRVLQADHKLLVKQIKKYIEASNQPALQPR